MRQWARKKAQNLLTLSPPWAYFNRNKSKPMKTKPLSEVVQSATPLPYRAKKSSDGIVIANESAYASGAASVTTVPRIRSEYESNAALLAHSPAALLKCVEALEDCVESLSRLPDADNAYRVTCLNQARAALAFATSVPVPL